MSEVLKLAPRRRSLPPQKLWDDNEKLMLVEMYNEGKSYLEISEKLGRTTNSIDSQIRKIRKENPT